MTAQHPAAPETETDANGLTDALHRAFHEHWSPGHSLNLYADSPLWQKQAEAVERIVAERVRVVEGERDAARERIEPTHEANKILLKTVSRADRERDAATARAESAEAAHEAEKAAHAETERLRALWFGENSQAQADLANEKAAHERTAEQLRLLREEVSS